MSTERTMASVDRIVLLAEIKGRGDVVQQVSDALTGRLRQKGEASVTAAWLIAVLDDVLTECHADMADLGVPVPTGATGGDDGAQG